MGAYSLRAMMLGWLLVLGLSSGFVQVFSGALRVRWFPRFELGVEYGQVVFAVIGIFLEVLWWLLAFKIAVEAMRSGARGRRQHSWTDNWIDDQQALHQLLFWFAALFSGYALYRGLGAYGLAAYGVLAVLLLPAILLILGMEDSFRRAFDPGAWTLLFRQAGVGYLLVAAKLAALIALAGVVHFELIPQNPRWLHGPLVRMAWLSALFVGYHQLGRLLDRDGREVQLRETAPAPVQVVEISPKEALAMRAAERYAAEQRYARAARELEKLAHSKGSSAQLHELYRNLLGLAGDQPRLLHHARYYVPELLAAGLEAEALAMHEFSVHTDPDFELPEARPVTQLFRAAMGAHHEDVAIRLAREFVRRFPDEPDAVPNGLSAARLLDRQGRDEDARQLLVELVRGFPKHPLRGELVAALETLEGVARRGS